MAYTPPICDSVDFVFNSTYTPPVCDLVNFDIGGTAPFEIESQNSEILISTQDAVWFEGEVLDSSASVININSDTHNWDILLEIEAISTVIEIEASLFNCSNTEPQDLPTETSPGDRSFGWGSTYVVDEHKCMSFADADFITKQYCLPDSGIIPIQFSICDGWITLNIFDNTVCVGYGAFYEWTLSYCCGYVNHMCYIDNPYCFTFADGVIFNTSVCVGYLQPSANDLHKCVLWDGTGTVFDFEYCFAYNEPGNNDVDKCVAWGPFSYYTLCYFGEEYVPPRSCQPVQFGFPSKYNLVRDVCEGIQFQLNTYAYHQDPRCPWQHVHSGIRDKYLIDSSVPFLVYPSAKESYYMLNNVLVKELITGRPIEVLQVQATTDIDSWLWQFQVTVASKDCLTLIQPDNGVYASIEIDINGYKWICTVENWTENRSFGSDAWTITGRSPSVIFTTPIAQVKSATIDNAYQGGQIVDDIVSNVHIPPNWPSQLSSWSTDWAAYNNTCTGFAPHSAWYMPENTVSYTDKTDVEVLKDILDAIGAYIQTNANANGSGCILYIKPRYAWQPWDWNENNTYIDWRTLIEDQMVEISRNNVYKPFYQGVYVIGESIGGTNDGTGSDSSSTAVFTDVCRDGWCGGGTATYAPMITSPYITSSKAGLEKGRMILGSVEEWVQHSLRINALCQNDISFGLYTPGDMVSVLERGIAWYGQVTGVTITATNSGGFVVSQTINVEEYKGQ